MEIADMLEQGVVNTSRDMSGWLKLVGIISIVMGALSIITIIGIIPGGILIWQGILLNRAGNGSREVGGGNVNSIIEVLKPLKIYFIIQGVLILFAIVGWIISVFTIGFGGLMDIFGGSGIY